MINKLLKRSYLLLTAMSALSCSGFADYYGCCGYEDNYNEECCDDDSFKIAAHALFVQPSQNIIWLTTESATDNDFTHYAFEYEWSPGGAVSASFQFSNNWGFAARYSYIQADTGTRVVSLSNINNSYLYSNPNSTFNYSDPRPEGGSGEVTGKLEHKMHTADLVTEYHCFISDCLKFKPFGGARIIFIKNKSNIYISDTADEAPFDTAGDGHFHELRTTAYGAVGGFEWAWNVCSDLHFMGYISASAMTSSDNSRFQQIKAGTPKETFTLNLDTDYKGTFSFDSEIGLTWNPSFFGKHFSLEALAVHRYISEVAIPFPALGTNSTGYSVHGGKLGIGLAF